MVRKPLVSIILNFYNEEDNLEDCLESIKRQSYQNYEIIAVDDGSTDSSAGVVRSYSRSMDIKMYRTPHVGIKKARRKGVKKSSGDLILVVDADEILEPEFISQIVKSFKEENVGAVGGILKSVGDGWVTEAYGALNEVFYKLRKKTEGEVDWIQGGCSAYRREALEDVGGLAREKVSADKDISWKMSDAGWKIVLNEGAVAYHKDPQTVRSVMRREYNIGKREYWLLKEHKGRMGWKELSRFYPLLITVLCLFSIIHIYFLIILIIITSATIISIYVLIKNYSGCPRFLFLKSWVAFTLINIAWSAGYLNSYIFRT